MAQIPNETLEQICPLMTPYYAVIAAQDGSVLMLPAVAVATIHQKEPIDMRQAYTLVPCLGRLQPAEKVREFVALTPDADPTPWVQRCKEHRALLTKIDADEAAKVKSGKGIVIPNKKIVTALDA